MSFSFLPFGFFCGSGFSVFLLLLAVVDYLMMVLVLSFVLISAIPSYDDDLAFQNSSCHSIFPAVAQSARYYVRSV